MKLKKLLIIVTASILIFSILLCLFTSSDYRRLNATISMSNRDIVPEYEHYDATVVLSMCEQLKNTDWTGNEQDAIDLFDSTLAEMNYFCGLLSVISVMNHENVYDTNIEDEYFYTRNLYTRTLDSFLTAAHSLTQGPCSQELKYHINQYDYDYLVYYKPLTTEEIALQDYRTTLENEYSIILNSIYDNVNFYYNGEEHIFNDLYDVNFYQDLDDDTYNKIYYDCTKKINEQIGALYIEVVKTNDQIAKLKGYDSFCDYADKELYFRDFGTEELKQYYSAVKSFTYDADPLNYYYEIPDIEISADELVAIVGKILNGASDKLDESYDYFWKNRLYSLGTEGCRFQGGYTTTISGLNPTEFIFCYLENSAYDITTLIHESGHFSNFYHSKQLDCCPVQFEVAEIHSTGLQLLMLNRYDKVLKNNDSNALKAYQLLEVLYSVQQGALYDEWQRYIYQNPDMTLDEINELFYKLCLEYGLSDSETLAYEWMYVNHNFTAPLYYISYSVSAISALQIWAQSLKNYSSAVKSWESLLDANEPFCYFRLMDEANISPFTDKESVLDTLNLSYDALLKTAFGDITGENDPLAA